MWHACCGFGVLQGGLPRDGSLERMAEVVICNRDRLTPLWQVYFERVRTLTGSPSPADRAAAAACLKRAVLTLLGSRKGPADSMENPGDPDVAPSGAAGPVGAAGSISVAAGSMRAALSRGGSGGPDAAEAARDDDAELETLLLDAVAQVCRHPTAYVDVRYVCVEIVHVVLQVCPPRPCVRTDHLHHLSDAVRLQHVCLVPPVSERPELCCAER